MPELVGKVSRITYRNESNHYTIAHVRTKTGNVCIVGRMGEIAPGESVRVEGEWTTHPRYGEQFAVSSCNVLPPEGEDQVRDYLASGRLPGVGPAMAARIVGRFGENAFDVLDNEPERLLEVPGIGKAKLAGIVEAWARARDQRDAAVFLQNLGLGSALQGRALSALGPGAVDMVRENPYLLAEKVPGIGFATADAAARRLGIAADAPERLQAAVSHVLEQAADRGHMFLPRDRLVGETSKLVDEPEAVVEAALDRMEESGTLVSAPLDKGRMAVYLRPFYDAETGLAHRVAAHATVPHETPDLSVEHVRTAAATEGGEILSEDQARVLLSMLSHRITILTGGPGTGKTTLIRAAVAIYEKAGVSVALAAPTGRAARRLEEVCGRPASTMHRLLAYDPHTGVFRKNFRDPLDVDAVVIDEASMVDAILMHHLMEAVPYNATVILCGDVDQLPPVGPGNPLSRLIESERLPAARLTRVYRQAAKSLIVRNAHRVLAGMPPVPGPDRDSADLSDFYHIDEDDPGRIARIVHSLCEKRIPEAFGMDPVSDIQVLTPMHRGECGTVNLNRLLRAGLNPAAAHGGDDAFSPGDKVMQVRNNYARDVFNGDIGVVRRVVPEDGVVEVDFYGGTVAYTGRDRDELTLAYAVSVHKSQGSEYPAVVMVLSTSHGVMLARNLLYTALTRARRLLVLVGGHEAVRRALENDAPKRRYTRLAEILKGM